jgi:pilus assembly protein CpaE
VLLADFLTERRVSIRSEVGEAADMNVCGEAATGLEAITQFNALKPDVMVMYLNMPEIDGVAATKIICEKHPEARVMLMAAEGKGETIRRAMLAGACDYLLMPFTLEELLAAIRRAAG